MFDYPQQTEVNRVVPKAKIYARASPSKRVKELFVAEVEEIVWKYKLAPETINLPAADGINEIQVFEIICKDSEVDEAVLQCINKAIPFPLLFRLVHPEHICFAVSYKRPSDTEASKFVIEASFRTEARPLNFNRPPLPVALDLAGLYEQLVRSHIPLPARTNERLCDQVERFNCIAAKETEQQRLKARLKQEKQFNRKVELNATLRSLARELHNLKQL